MTNSEEKQEAVWQSVSISLSDRKRLATFYAWLRMLGAISGVEIDSNELSAVRAFPVLSFSATGNPTYRLACRRTWNRSERNNERARHQHPAPAEMRKWFNYENF